MTVTSSSLTFQSVKPWINGLGFHFDPFRYLEASSDPYLGKYLVGHETFSVAWDEAPALLLAPAGGGKTTQRIYTIRSCWVGRGGAHPFPISYYIPDYFSDVHEISIDQHLKCLTQAGSVALLIGLVFRPERFLALPQSSQQKLAAFFNENLPGPLERYLEILLETGSPLDILPLLDRTYLISQLPDPQKLAEFCKMIQESPKIPPANRSAYEQFDAMVELILGDLGFRSVFFLIDGVDGLFASGSNPSIAIQMIAPVLKKAQDWAKRHIYIKGFLPIETNAPLKLCLGELHSQFRQALMQWDVTSLAEVIRKRVYSASGGEFGSLDAISSPELRDMETTLARVIRPLPREAIVLVQRVFQEYQQRVQGDTGRLEIEDVEKALHWYQLSQERLNLKGGNESLPNWRTPHGT